MISQKILNNYAIYKAAMPSLDFYVLNRTPRLSGRLPNNDLIIIHHVMPSFPSYFFHPESRLGESHFNVSVALAFTFSTGIYQPAHRRDDSNSGSSRSKTKPLVKRADPSPYPGSDTPVATNEPSYLNFAPDNPNDLSKAERIHYTFVNEVLALATAGRSTIVDTDTTVFSRWFDDHPDVTETVTEVFNVLVDDNGVAQAPVQDFIFDNVDFLSLCGDSDDGSDACEDCNAIAIGGYTAIDRSDDGDGLEKTHFCKHAYTFANLVDINCSSLDDYPSGKMENLGRIMLNVFLHYSTVGSQTTEGGAIGIVENADYLPTFYPSRAHGLIAQDNNAGECDGSAENYAWLSQV